MRKFISLALTLVLFIGLCACGEAPVEPQERSCGLFIKLEADDVFAVSFGTDTESGSMSNADETLLGYGTTVHFDFAGDAAEKTEPAVIDYTVYIYDKDMNVLGSGSFSHDFCGMARVDLTVTAEHKIIDPSVRQFVGGDTVVQITKTKPADGVSVASAEVTMSERPDAAEKINEAIQTVNKSFYGKQLESSKKAYELCLEDADEDAEISSFSMSRYLRVMRGDTAVLSFRMYDKTCLGTKDEINISGHNFDAQTGAELKLSDLADDFSRLRTLCAEKILSATTGESRFADVIFVEGYTETLQELISDGHWYLSSEGLVISANPGSIALQSFGMFEFTVSYTDLNGIIKPAFLPESPTGSGGDMSFEKYDADAKGLSLVGSVPDDAADAVLASVSGNVYEVCVYSCSVNDKGRYSLGTQLWYCSDLSDGASFVIPVKLTAEPNVYVGFLRADGVYERRLLSLGSDGSIVSSDPDGLDKGLDITKELPYQTDLNGDGIGEKISTEKTEDGRVVLTIISSEKSYEIVTDIVKSFKLRVNDLDGDGVRELYYDGKNADGTYVCGCAVFDHSSFDSVRFDGSDKLSARILGFEDGKLIVKGDSEQSYVFSAGQFVAG